MFKLLIFFSILLASHSLKASSGTDTKVPGLETSIPSLENLEGSPGNPKQGLNNKKIADFFKEAPYKIIDYSISKKNAPNPIEISASAIDFKADEFSGKELIEYTKSFNVLEDKNKIHPELYKRYNAFKDSSFELKNNQLILYSLDRASIKKWILSSIKGKNDIPVLNRNEIKKDLQNDFIEGLKISMDSKALIDENTALEKYFKQAIIDSILNLDKEVFISEIYKKSNNAFLKKQNSSIFIYSHFPEAQKNVKTFDIHIGITNLAVPAEGSESAAQVNAPQSDSAVNTQERPMRTASPAAQVNAPQSDSAVNTQERPMRTASPAAQVNAPQSDSPVNTQAQAISDAKAKAAQFVAAAKIASGNAQAAQSSSGALVFVNEILSIQTQMQGLKEKLNQLDRTIDISDDVQKIADYLAIAQDAQKAQEKAQSISAAKAKAARFVAAAKIASGNAQAAQSSSGALVFVNEIVSNESEIKILQNQLRQLDPTIDISDDVQKIADYLAIAQNSLKDKAYSDSLNSFNSAHALIDMFDEKGRPKQRIRPDFFLGEKRNVEEFDTNIKKIAKSFPRVDFSNSLKKSKQALDKIQNFIQNILTPALVSQKEQIVGEAKLAFEKATDSTKLFLNSHSELGEIKKRKNKLNMLMQFLNQFGVTMDISNEIKEIDNNLSIAQQIVNNKKQKEIQTITETKEQNISKAQINEKLAKKQKFDDSALANILNQEIKSIQNNMVRLKEELNSLDSTIDISSDIAKINTIEQNILEHLKNNADAEIEIFVNEAKKELEKLNRLSGMRTITQFIDFIQRLKIAEILYLNSKARDIISNLKNDIKILDIQKKIISKLPALSDKEIEHYKSLFQVIPTSRQSVEILKLTYPLRDLNTFNALNDKINIDNTINKLSQFISNSQKKIKDKINEEMKEALPSKNIKKFKELKNILDTMKTVNEYLTPNYKIDISEELEKITNYLNAL